MDNPIYVLKANEDTWGPSANSKRNSLLKKAVLIIVVIILLGSLVFQDNLFAELSFGAKAILIALVSGTFSLKTKEKVAKPLEIRFYNDYLVLFRENNYYSPRLTRMEFDKFLYKDIKEIVYRPETHKISIYGVVEGKWYNYNKDGTIPSTPSRDKTVDSFRSFYTNASPEIDFVAEIESHTPIKVRIDNN